jgi:hypothetical protein
MFPLGALHINIRWEGVDYKGPPKNKLKRIKEPFNTQLYDLIPPTAGVVEVLEVTLDEHYLISYFSKGLI